MQTGQVSVLAPLLLLVLGVCSAKLHPRPLGALSGGVEMLVSSLSSSFSSHPWSLSQKSEGTEVRRPGDASPSVKLGNAIFTGTQTWSLDNRTINSFLGIEYATAERFKYSVLTTDYGAGEVGAAHMGPKCIQGALAGSEAAGAEDCLYLNVYVPASLQTAGAALPVMVFIHGGSFISGDASLYLPTRLLDEDVILVVIQYRLGALGWFSLNNNDAPGNAGLSDQLNALRWVKKNIAAFHGDPGNVTVFGQSAGSVSVSMIVTVANPAENLFRAAIAESGSALEYWAIDEHPLQSAVELAQTCGCQNTSVEDAIFACLTGMAPGDIVVCHHEYVSWQRMNARLGFDGTAPVVQSNETVDNPLITMLPYDYIEQGLSNQVPFMSGCNRDEGSFVFGVMTDSFLAPNGLVNDTEYFENDFIPDILYAAGIDDSTHVFSNALQEKFFPGVDFSSYDDVAPGAVDLTGMLFLKSGTYNYAKIHSRFTNSSSYYYSFDFESQNSFFDIWYMGEEPPFDGGVTHADELMYIFSIPSAMDDRQRLTSKRMVKLWTNFARFTNPTPEGEYEVPDLGLVKWEPLSADGHNFLLIEDALTLQDYYPDRYTIRMDTILKADTTTTTSNLTPAPPASTSEGQSTVTTTEDPEVPVYTKQEYNDLKKQSDAFMVSMVVFVVLFGISTGVAIFFFSKKR